MTSHLDMTGLSDDSLHGASPPLTGAQVAELERRDAEADAGLVRGELWQLVRASLTLLE